MSDELNDSIIKLAGPLLGKHIFSNMRGPSNVVRLPLPGRAPVAGNASNMISFMAGKPTLPARAAGDAGVATYHGPSKGLRELNEQGRKFRAAQEAVPDLRAERNVQDLYDSAFDRGMNYGRSTPAPASAAPASVAPATTAARPGGAGSVLKSLRGFAGKYPNTTGLGAAGLGLGGVALGSRLGVVPDTMSQMLNTPGPAPSADAGGSAARAAAGSAAAATDAGVSGAMPVPRQDSTGLATAPGATAGAGALGNAAAQQGRNLDGPASSWYDTLVTNNPLLQGKTWQDIGDHIKRHPWEYGLGLAGAGGLAALLSQPADEDEEDQPLHFKYSDFRKAGQLPGAAPAASVAPVAKPAAPAPSPRTAVPTPLPRLTANYNQNMAKIRDSSVIKAPAANSVRALQQAPGGVVSGGLNMLGNVFNKGLLGSMHAGLNSGLYAAGKPVEWAARAAYGDNAPVSQGWRTWNNQLAENASAGLQDVGSAFSTYDGPSARSLHYRQQHGAAAPLPTPKPSLADPAVLAMRAAPKAMGAVSKGVSTAAEMAGAPDMADWANEYGNNLSAGKPNTLDQTAETLSMFGPVGAPLSLAGKGLSAGGKALGAGRIAGAGNMLQRAGRMADPIRAVTAPGAAAGSFLGSKVLGPVASAVGKRVVAPVVSKVPRVGPAMGRAATGAGGAIPGALSTAGGIAGSVATLEGAGALAARDPVGEFKNMPQTSSGIDQLAQDVRYISQDGQNDRVMASIGGGLNSPSGAATRARIAPTQASAELTTGFDPQTGKWDTAATQAMTPEQATHMQNATTQLEQQLPQLPADQQLQVGQKIMENRLALWSRETGQDPTELMNKVSGDGFQVEDLQRLTTNMQQDAAKTNSPIPSMQDAFAWFQNPETPAWQKAALLVGVPLALIGGLQALSGGGMENILMALLGGGAMAAGAGLFGGSPMPGMPGSQLAAAPPPTTVPQEALQTAKTDLTNYMSDGVISPEEFKSIQQPAGRQALLGLNDADLAGVLPAITKGNPGMRQELLSGLDQYDKAKSGWAGSLGVDVDARARSALGSQLGLTDAEAQRVWPLILKQRQAL